MNWIDGDYEKIERNGKNYMRVNNRYYVGDELGEGGFGQVFETYDEHEKKVKALKVFRDFSPYSRSLLQENLTEVKKIQDRTNGKIGNSDDLVRILDIFILPQSGRLAYVMEKIDMTGLYSLKDYHKGRIDLDAEQKCRIAMEIADFFMEFHSEGLFYKDVNEDNLFFSVDGKLVVLDPDNITHRDVGIVKGTPGYIAPEVYAGEKNPSGYTDLFSVALYFYRLFIGNHNVYDGKRALDMYKGHDNMNPAELFSTTRGRMAVFVFDKNNTENSIQNIQIPGRPKTEMMYQAFVQRWNSLPEILRDAFTRSFVLEDEEDGTIKTSGRILAFMWKEIFGYLINNGIYYCPHCGRKHLNGGPGKVICDMCGDEFQINNGLSVVNLDQLPDWTDYMNEPHREVEEELESEKNRVETVEYEAKKKTVKLEETEAQKATVVVEAIEELKDDEKQTERRKQPSKKKDSTKRVLLILSIPVKDGRIVRRDKKESDVVVETEIEYSEGRIITTKDLSEMYKDKELFQLLYSKSKDELALRNVSGFSMIYKKDKFDDVWIDLKPESMAKNKNDCTVRLRDEMLIRCDEESLFITVKVEK